MATGRDRAGARAADELRRGAGHAGGAGLTATQRESGLAARPAFYALRPGGWRDMITLLHPPYTAWHLSYVALGTAAVPGVIHGDRLAAALGAFFLAVGIGAHALDELNGRPLRTRLGRGVLIGLGAGGVLGGVAVGIAGIIIVSPLLIPLVVAGGLIAPAYNLELARGRFHSDFWFALAWGAFPAFTGYFVQTLTVRVEGVAVAAACFLFTLAQRRLSTPVRELRRRTVDVSGEQRMADGTVLPLDAARVAAPLEGALSALWLALVVLAVGLLVARL